MLKLIVLSVVIAAVAAQNSSFMRMMMMQQMMGGMRGSSGQTGQPGRTGATGARGMPGMAGMMAGMSNPLMLCRATEDAFSSAIPCRSMPQLCNIRSIRKYKMPNLLKCSPMGIGCCLKDVQSMMIARNL